LLASTGLLRDDLSPSKDIGNRFLKPLGCARV
jgi:hypothetical protein